MIQAVVGLVGCKPYTCNMKKEIVKKDDNLVAVGRMIDDNGKIDVSTLPEDVISRCRDITRGVKDNESLKGFGADVMNAGNSCGSKLLEMNKIDRAGVVGTEIRTLVDTIRETDLQDPENLKGWRKFVARIPFVGVKTVQSAEKIIAKYESSKETVDKVVERVKDMQIDLEQDKNVLAVMEDKTIELVEYLSTHVVALAVLQKDEQAKLDEMKKQRESDPTSVSQEMIIKQKEFVDKIERKGYDLFMAGQKSRNLDLPQIKMMLLNTEKLQENAEQIWRTIIPNWQQSIAIAIMNEKQKKTLEAQQLIKDVNNNITLANARMLKETTAGISIESSRSIIDADTYVKARMDTISALEELIEANTTMKTERDASLKKIIDFEKKTGARLAELSSRAEQQLTGDFYENPEKFIPEALK